MEFENKVKELENIAAKLESGECTLDESVKLYERAMELTKECNKQLTNAKLKIDQLSDIEKAE